MEQPLSSAQAHASCSRRMQAVQTPVIPVIGELIRRHPGCISLGQGVVHYGPPPAAMVRMQEFFGRAESHRYGPVEGIPLLLEAIRRKLGQDNGMDIGPGRRVLVTAGANMAFLNALFAITDPGDEVILPRPCYFNQEMALRMLSCRPVLVATGPGYQLDLQALAAAITDRTRAIVTVSPNNPSGAVYDEASLRAVNDLCRSRGIYHISDEAYEYFTYGSARHVSPGAFAGAGNHTISLYTLSKAYGFASWRIGYMVIPEHLYAAVLKAQDTNLICATGIAQFAALGALEAGRGYCRAQLGHIDQVRERALEALAGLGGLCRVGPADGALYLLVRLETRLDDMAVATRLIAEHGVAVIPGSAFALRDGCYLRVSYGALEVDTAAEGLRRLVRGLRTIAAG